MNFSEDANVVNRWDEVLIDDEFYIQTCDNGRFVTYADYKKLEEEHRSLVKRYDALTPIPPHDFFDKVDQDD